MLNHKIIMIVLFLKTMAVIPIRKTKSWRNNYKQQQQRNSCRHKCAMETDIKIDEGVGENHIVMKHSTSITSV